MKLLNLKIITPEELVSEEQVEGVTIPTTNGEITILPDHIPLIASLASGDIVAHKNNEDIPYAVVGGFAEIKKDEKGNTVVAILADFAEHISSLTDDEINKSLEKAEELKKQRDNNEVVDFEHFATELERQLTRVKIADKWRTKKYRK